MQDVDGQQKPPTTRVRPHSRNQPGEKDLLRAGTIDTQDPLPPTLEANQALVHYFDPYGGYSRVGRVIGSHTVTRGKRKGTVILKIAAFPSGQVTRNIDEVKWVQ